MLTPKRNRDGFAETLQHCTAIITFHLLNPISSYRVYQRSTISYLHETVTKDIADLNTMYPDTEPPFLAQ